MVRIWELQHIVQEKFIVFASMKTVYLCMNFFRGKKMVLLV